MDQQAVRSQNISPLTWYSRFWNIKLGGLYGRDLLTGPRFGKVTRPARYPDFGILSQGAYMAGICLLTHVLAKQKVKQVIPDFRMSG